MEDKTIIAIAAMTVLSIVLLLVLFAPGENLDIKIALAASITSVIGVIVAYAYGIEKGKNNAMVKVNGAS